MDAMPASQLVKGLRHLVKDVATPPVSKVNRIGTGELNGAATKSTSLISFDDQQVRYCSIDVQQLCDEGSFEAVIWLLLNGDVANGEQLADWCSILNEAAVVDQPIADMIGAVPLQTRPLDLLPLGISLLSCFDPTPCDRNLAATRSQFWRVLAQLPVLLHVAFGGRLSDGRAFDEDTDRSTSFAGRLLRILRDDNVAPSPTEEHAMNAVLICECLTEQRPACMLARMFGDTVNDAVAGLKAASAMYVSQLRNDPFAWTAEKLKSFKTPEQTEQWWLARTPQAMPFGFQEEREDGRSEVLRHHCRELLGTVENMVMEASASRLETLLARENQQPTVDWTATRALTLLGVPEDRVSLAIGIARMVGWAAQTIEQHGSGN
ncbi:citrate/2-methylcitrate synthase [Fuerstiella marisgermanici]|uniref:citrate synthase (unknown stereospecificity) n=1 Tax=Fuerstiella marisgermanici TaxID=1891926 RepID=A0A1P8WL13_9PLAN|nr:citrate/2-methylcitrate synthase [Fuerstiella marisgermanici]APZ94748.1 2-methylcitrate synthase 1 [Fuerstiella marisgermanici]